MVNALFSAILEALNKRKRRMLEGVETTVPPPFFPPIRRKILRELGRDEFEKELLELIKQFVERHGKGK